MPLTTRHVDGRRIDSTDDEQWTEVRLPGYPDLRCPDCEWQMFTREGGGRARHFYHAPGRPDHCSYAEEGADHRHTKMLIAEAVHTAGWTAKIEHFGGGWRADVLATSPSGQRRIAFEPQFSYIHPVRARERSDAHRTSDVETVWLPVPARVGQLEGLPWARLHYDERDPHVGVWTFEGGRWGPRRLPLGVFIQRICIGRLAYDGMHWADEQDRNRAAREAREQEKRREEQARLAEAREVYAATEGGRIDREIAVQREKRAQERRREQGEAEAARRIAEPWVPTNAMSDEELLVLTKRYVDEPKPFPGWIPVGDRLHVALARRGLLHD